MKVQPVAMGAESAFGEWRRNYSTVFSFEIGERQFLFGHQLAATHPSDDDPRLFRWFIQELLPGGKLGEDETDSGWWNNHYDVLFPFATDKGVFFYGHHWETHYWFIQEFSLGGKIGKEICNGHWNNAYEVQFHFLVNKQQYFYGHNTHKNSWFIQKIHDDGKMGDETAHGTWGRAYEVQFPFKIGKEQYFYGQDVHHKGDGHWFIQRIQPDGTMGDETANGKWAGKYEVQFPFSIEGKHYFFGHSRRNFNWFIQELEEGGLMGRELANGQWHKGFKILVPFNVGKRQWFFGLDYDRWWFIRPLNQPEIVFNGV